VTGVVVVVANDWRYAGKRYLVFGEWRSVERTSKLREKCFSISTGAD
jgi:hypothetical protein